jgi:cell fate (sporulation/competence/biofilm development) regulator YlbF (YheA/YmcA/DUF963 family)
MDVMKKARELAGEILKTDEYARLENARRDVDEDNFAAGLLQDMELLQKEYLRSAREGAGKEELAEIERIMKGKHEEIMGYDATRELIVAKSSFDKLMQRINAEIMSGIQECSDDGCAGCEGCS